ncbi:MAG: C69 family dipeptidase [Bacteroidetes bacterium]|nr:C69 family dipeptidase [Bacteroidota bacterium]MBL6943811.1 C69 family dipeptidase [Bacteroidales bacterium]
MRNIFKSIAIVIFSLLISNTSLAQTADKSDWAGGYPEGCTSITVGKAASFDGSVITSHTDDSHRTRSWIDIVPAQKHAKGEVVSMYKRIKNDSLAMPAYGHLEVGSIPQVSHTNGYINTAYPSLNNKQLGIGESTFGGRDELQSDSGIIDCQRLCQLMLARESTAREAIKTAGKLLEKYGWNDYGEALTIADKNEVWHLEIVGPGQGKTGAVWAAQRVPDGHISVNANASTIKQIDLKDKDYFMASENIFDVALQNGWWNPEEEEFRFCYAYAPGSRNSIAARRREWRVFDLLAPSLKLDPNAENYPFSVKPDTLVTLENLIDVFKDYYEETPFDMTKSLTVTDENGKTIISPLASPHMPYDANKLHKINGGWGPLGERTIARWYTMYATIIQLRNWLPDEIGGVEWLAMDNVATSIYVPIYGCVSDLPEQYKTPGRINGYTLNSAWWIFNRLGTLASQRWGDMRHDVDAVWKPMQLNLIESQKSVDKKALELYYQNKIAAIEFLTRYSNEQGEKVMKEAIKLGDSLWTKYDEKF